MYMSLVTDQSDCLLSTSILTRNELTPGSDGVEWHMEGHRHTHPMH